VLALPLVIRFILDRKPRSIPVPDWKPKYDTMHDDIPEIDEIRRTHRELESYRKQLRSELERLHSEAESIEANDTDNDLIRRTEKIELKSVLNQIDVLESQLVWVQKMLAAMMSYGSVAHRENVAGVSNEINGMAAEEVRSTLLEKTPDPEEIEKLTEMLDISSVDREASND
jgi:hypothetical protein